MLRNLLAKAATLPVPVLVKVCAGLATAAAGLAVCAAASLWLNLHQYGKLAAADAECEARVLRSAIDARAAAEDERDRAQAQISAQASAERKAADDKLQAATTRAREAARKLEELIRAHPSLPADAEPGDCLLPADWVRAADAAVLEARSARP